MRSPAVLIARWILLSVVCVLGGPILGAGARLSAQTQDIQEFGPGPALTAEKVYRTLSQLSASIDLKSFPKAATLRDALEWLYERLAEQNVELPYLLDLEAVQRENPGVELLSVPIKVTGLPRRMPAARLLKEILRQTRFRGCVIVLRPGMYLEITTPRAAGAEGVRVLVWWDLLGGFCRGG